jgi:ribosomal protein S12
MDGSDRKLSVSLCVFVRRFKTTQEDITTVRFAITVNPEVQKSNESRKEKRKKKRNKPNILASSIWVEVQGIQHARCS